MSPWRMDLHIHTVLSPCAHREMTPPNIVQSAIQAGLSLIAVTDHNSIGNAAAVIQAARHTELIVIPGMELQTREEIHLICLFLNMQWADKFNTIISKQLPAVMNKSEFFGEQWLVDHKGELIGTEPRLLLNSTQITLDEAIKTVSFCNGICFPAHIDRKAYSLFSQLGFIPPELPTTCLELSCNIYAEEARMIFTSLHDYNLICSSDAHSLADIGRGYTTILTSNRPSFLELRSVLLQKGNIRLVMRMKELSLHILDIVENSITAQATKVDICVIEDPSQDSLQITVTDNGIGMTGDVVNRVSDPFYTTRTTRKVGLGIPLLKAAAERCSGSFVLHSTPGKGTTLTASFQHAHIDRAPMGNIIDTIVNIINGHPDVDIQYNHCFENQSLYFSASELREQLVDVPLNNPAVLTWIKKYLQDEFTRIKSVNDN